LLKDYRMLLRNRCVEGKRERRVAWIGVLVRKMVHCWSSGCILERGEKRTCGV
jgi:hypothetical protein